MRERLERAKPFLIGGGIALGVAGIFVAGMIANARAGASRNEYKMQGRS